MSRLSKDTRGFSGVGMNLDDAPELVGKDYVMSAYNVRTIANGESESGYLTNIESTEPIPMILPDGINKTVGSAVFESIKKAYYFNCNSQGKNLLIEFDYDTQTPSILFTNLVDSDGVDVLPLSTKDYMTNIRLVDSRFLYFKSGLNQPSRIDLKKLKEGSYGVVKKSDFLVLRAQPKTIPTYYYSSDSKISANRIKGKLFKFREQYEYDDFQLSAWGSASAMSVPENEGTPVSGADVTQNNHLVVSVDAGDSRVMTLNISASYSNLDWMMVKSIARSKVLSLPLNLDKENGVYESYDPTTNKYTFCFFNNELYENIDPLETDLLYDAVPDEIEDLEIVNGNILTLAAPKEGYEKPEALITLGSSSVDPQIAKGNSSQPNPLERSWRQSQEDNGDDKYFRAWINFYGIARVGDKIRIDFENLDSVFQYTLIDFTVGITQDGNTYEAIRKMAESINNSAVINHGSYVELTFSTPRKNEEPSNGQSKRVRDVYIDLANAGDGTSKSVLSLKAGSSYPVALAYYDEFGKPFPLVNAGVAKTKSLAQLSGLAPAINWQINSDPPSGAATYQILLAKNQSHEKVVYINGLLNETRTSANYFTFKINSLKSFNDVNSSSVVNYDYAEGDRCAIVSYNSGTNVTYYNNPCVDVEVAEFKIETEKENDIDVVNYYLKIRKPSNLSAADVTNKNILLEIYTPRKGAIESTNSATVYYEIGQQFSITNGKHDVTNGIITKGDCYIKSRSLENAINTNELERHVVEDFNFSDFYKSDYLPYGRPRAANDVPERSFVSAGIRYSDTYLTGGKINNLNRFYPERLYGNKSGEASSTNGIIKRIAQRGNVLICFQELATGYIPVNSTILETLDAKENLSISDKLLNNIRYAQGENYGIGKASASLAYGNDTYYFVDPNKSAPIAVTLGGLQNISGKLSKFFKSTLHRALNNGRTLIGIYDGSNEEYLISIEDETDVVFQLRFDTGSWKLTDSHINPTGVDLITFPSKGSLFYNNNTQQFTYTPDAGTGGETDNFTISFTSNGQAYTKRACFTILSGDAAVNDFFFASKTGLEVSTVVESNSVLITGNNIPVPISITGGEYRINGGSWTSATGLIDPNSTLQVRGTTSPNFLTTKNVTVAVAGKSSIFSMTTKAES